MHTPTLAILALALAACTPPAGIGDPCLPSRPAPTVDGSTCAPDAGCFTGAEVYIETTATECRSRVCLTYHWDEVTAPDQRNERSFCTCRCAGPGDPSTLCQCPAGFTCGAPINEGPPGFRGSYCVRSELVQ